MTMGTMGMILMASHVPSPCRTCCHSSYCRDIPSSEMKEHTECDSFRRYEAQRQYEEDFWRLYEEEERWREAQMIDDDDD